MAEGQEDISIANASLATTQNKVIVITRQLVNLNMALSAVQLKEFNSDEILVRLEFVETLNNSFDQAQAILEGMDSSMIDSDVRDKFTCTYFEVKAKLTRQLTILRAVEQPQQRTSTFRQFSLDEVASHSLHNRSSRLPELKIPTFSGSYLEWTDFFSMFCTVVDKDNITKIEKFQHLRACLKGAALDTISSLEPTDANYDEAIKLLKRRFDNKLVIFQSHIKEIFDLNKVERDFPASIRQLSDKLSAHMRALQNMSSKEEIADGFLIHVITSKFDLKSKAKWEEELYTDKLPTWNCLENFLDKRCRFLETFENAKRSTNQNFKNKNQGRNVLVAAASSGCAFCYAKDHFISKCMRFGNLSPNIRFKEAKRLQLCLNCLKKGHFLKDCKSSHCRFCTSKHHSLMHIDNIQQDFSPAKFSSTETAIESLTKSTAQATLASSSAALSSTAHGHAMDHNVLLATAIILVKNSSGSFLPCRAILDSASQLNFITTRFAKQLQLHTNKSNISFSGIGVNPFVADKFVNIMVKSQIGNFSTSFSAVVVPSITDYEPSAGPYTANWNIPQNIKLADPFFNKLGRTDVLIGASLFFELMCVGQIRLGRNLPILQKTLFGWVVSGGGFSSSKASSLAATGKYLTDKKEQDVGDLIKNFWEIENNFNGTDTHSADDDYCESYFKQTTTRLVSGDYSVNLPKSKPSSVLGSSYGLALQRFKSLEKKLNKFPDTKKQYVAFINEYINLQHMSLLSYSPVESTYYLPHHCVRKEESTTTKLRVVFDGSAKTLSGYSLNDILYTGPTIQPKLFSTILRFRLFKVALTGDICKMYRCVKVSHPDDHLQCILWRENPNEEIKTYKLNTVTYGTKPAAFLAIRAMHQLTFDEETNFPMAAKIIRRDFYVDDMITGGESVDKVKQIRQQVTELLKRGNFPIRKWCSNEEAVLNDIPVAEREQFFKFHDEIDITKTLGLVWNPKSDNFIFSFHLSSSSSTVSKRSILSSIASIYDPLGLIGPILTKAKLFMQTLWKYNLNWDESLPQSLHLAWTDFISKLSAVNSLVFPRFVQMSSGRVQIHAFCDASLAAYGACIYVRSEFEGVIKTNLLCSKSRVAPLKTITIPKLELSAALLLSELVNTVLNSFPAQCEVHCWSDSMIVLSWLREQSSNFNVFVANRVSRIQNLTRQMTWHHVPTDVNPADILSRGATPDELFSSALWKCGPQFLKQHSSTWPELLTFVSDLPERKRTALLVTPLNDWTMNCKYHNSFSQMQRIFGYVYKFVVLKFKLHQEITAGPLTPYELKMGTNVLIRNIQKIHFSCEYNALKANNTVSTTSKLYPLTPFIDSTDLIRVGGRLENSELNFEAKHPIVLPKLHHFTRAMIMGFHKRLLHAGPQCLLATIRLQYWPLGGRKAVSAVIAKCIQCFRLRPKYVQHIMGNLPYERVTQCRTFYTTGVDFCGPFYYKSGVRKRLPIKCYICIFVCFATKATHLELVSELSTPAFLAALKRFISIRGKPHTIWSDNATNFVGAKNELLELKQLLISKSHLDLVHQECLNEGIHWKFIPPRSPHFGGIWEAAVKAAKYHFKRVVGVTILSFDELRTLVCQISAILNSRPLCPISDNPNDLDVITPGHFLIGASLMSLTEPDITDANISRLSRWQQVSFIQQVFWKKWSTAYLTLLQERNKWRKSSANISKGDMVLLKDENLPPQKWHMGRVKDVICGEDGVARVAEIQTSNKVLRRAVKNLAVLPIDEHKVESQGLSTGGGCSPQVRPCSL